MQFRTLALATTSLVALGLSAQANAANEMMGDVTLGYGHNWENYDIGGEGSVDVEFPAIFGQGRVNLPYTDTVNIQLDALGGTSLDIGDEPFFSGKSGMLNGHFALGGHVNYRDDQGLLGVFAATGRSYDFMSGSAVFMTGIEGQYYCGPWTFRGQLAYLDADDDWFMLKNAGAVRLGANYYMGKNIKFTADVAYVDGEQAITEYDADQWAWAAGAHYWFGKSIPASAFVEYRGRQADVNPGGDAWEIEDHTVNFGLAFHFGGDGFEDADRNGASADLPDLGWYRLPID